MRSTVNNDLRELRLQIQDRTGRNGAVRNSGGGLKKSTITHCTRDVEGICRSGRREQLDPMLYGRSNGRSISARFRANVSASNRKHELRCAEGSDGDPGCVGAGVASACPIQAGNEGALGRRLRAGGEDAPGMRRRGRSMVWRGFQRRHEGLGVGERA